MAGVAEIVLIPMTQVFPERNATVTSNNVHLGAPGAALVHRRLAGPRSADKHQLEMRVSNFLLLQNRLCGDIRHGASFDPDIQNRRGCSRRFAGISRRERLSGWIREG